MPTKNNSAEMKLAITLAGEISKHAPVLSGGPITENFATFAGLGYDAVELHWANPDQIDLPKAASACKEFDMTISAFATGRAYVQEGLSLIEEDAGLRKAAIQRLFSFIDAASIFRSTVIIGCIRGNIGPEKAQEYYLERLAQSTLSVAAYGESRGVPIVFEAINRYENNYLNTAAETLAFIRNYNLPNTKILLDTFHMNIEEPNLPKAIVDCGDMLGYMHFADSNRLYAGAGHINFRDIVDALKSICYTGFISAECLPLPNSDTAVRKWIEGVKSAF